MYVDSLQLIFPRGSLLTDPTLEHVADKHPDNPKEGQGSNAPSLQNQNRESGEDKLPKWLKL